VKLLSRERLRQVAMVGGIESFGVILGGIAGLLIVNVLPKEQYAAYTFLIACTTLMMGITDLGLAHCCLPVVGQRNRDIPWVVAACHHVFHKRWTLLSAGLLIIVPYWYFTSREHGWTGPGYWLASALVLGVVLIQLREHYANTVLLILAQSSTLNRIAFASHAARIALVGAVLLAPMTACSTAGLLIATAGASLMSLMLYGRAFRAQGIGTHRLDAADAKRVDGEIIRIAKPLCRPSSTRCRAWSRCSSSRSSARPAWWPKWGPSVGWPWRWWWWTGWPTCCCSRRSPGRRRGRASCGCCRRFMASTCWRWPAPSSRRSCSRNTGSCCWASSTAA
jgi:hypothetical protein